MISVTEIVLIVAGILAIILGYLIPNGHGGGDDDGSLTEQKVNEMVKKAVQNSQGQIDDLLDECMEEAINKAERAMDRVTNEKMTAISEYSDTVMNDIHKNHDEVMFMYDMLNDKHKNLRNTVSEVTRAAKEVKQTAEEAALTAEHAEAAARTAREAALKAETSTAYTGRVMAMADTSVPAHNVITPQKMPEQEFEYYDEDDYTEEEIPEPLYRNEEFYEELPDVNDAVVSPEIPEFESLSDILDRADSASAEKTSNKVIGYGQEPGNQEGVLPETYSDGQYQENAYYDSGYDVNNYEENAAVQNEYPVDMNEEQGAAPEFVQAPVSAQDNVNEGYTDMQVQPQIQPMQQESQEFSGAKVVSIADAPRKKVVEPQERLQRAPERRQAVIENSDDPISRNQRILDMHKQGKSAVVIARELRLGIGEVKLVIDLASKHKKNRSSIM